MVKTAITLRIVDHSSVFSRFRSNPCFSLKKWFIPRVVYTRVYLGRGYTGLYAFPVPWWEGTWVYMPSLYPVGRCARVCTPGMYTRYRALTTYSAVHVALIPVSLLVVGFSSRKRTSSHLRINLSSGQKGLQYGKETRYRESSCTRNAGIVQPF